VLENLRATRLFVTAGDGVGVAGDGDSDPANPGVERALRAHSEDFTAAARKADLDLTWEPARGSHEWPVWRRALTAAARWDLFESVPDPPESWTYGTVARSGAMWDLRFRFEEPPDRVQRFERRGSVLRGAGAGVVSISGPGGLERRELLPFETAL
jgi:hypothetical protein